MKIFPTLLLLLALSGFSVAQDLSDEGESVAAKTDRVTEELADDQDELSADVQQLVLEQTVPQVIELLSEVEDIMDETIDYLDEWETGGKTIAAQTEIIEKIHAAAKAKQASGSQGQAGGAMMDMMERMMGKDGEEGSGEKKEGDQAGDQAGEGQTGNSDAANNASNGKAGATVVERSVPKAAGGSGKSLPKEFQQAIDAYNRGLEEYER